MVGGGAPGEVIGIVHAITTTDGPIIGPSRDFMAVWIRGGEDITVAVIGTVARGTTDGFLMTDLCTAGTGVINRPRPPQWLLGDGGRGPHSNISVNIA